MSGYSRFSRRSGKRRKMRMLIAEREKLGLPPLDEAALIDMINKGVGRPEKTPHPPKRLRVPKSIRSSKHATKNTDQAVAWLVEFWEQIDGPILRAVRERYGMEQHEAIKVLSAAKSLRDQARFGGRK